MRDVYQYATHVTLVKKMSHVHDDADNAHEVADEDTHDVDCWSRSGTRNTTGRRGVLFSFFTDPD